MCSEGDPYRVVVALSFLFCTSVVDTNTFSNRFSYALTIILGTVISVRNSVGVFHIEITKLKGTIVHQIMLIP